MRRSTVFVFPIFAICVASPAAAQQSPDGQVPHSVNGQGPPSVGDINAGLQDMGLLEEDIVGDYDSIRAFYGQGYADKAVAAGLLQKPANADELEQRGGGTIMYVDYLWRYQTDANNNFIIPYEISSSATFPDSQRTTIVQALQTLSDEVGGYIVFVEKDSSHDAFITITSSSGCWSYIGQTGYASQAGGQQLNLQPNDDWGWGCVHAGIVQHEMMHALGFFHEQSRPDRDDYVTINYANIESGKEHNFEKSDYIDTQGSAYDYSSLMHYGTHSFSSNGEATIDAGDNQIGQRDGPSDLDIIQLRLLYQCDNEIRTTSEYNAAPCTERCACSAGMTGCGGNNAYCRGDLTCSDNTCQASSGPSDPTPSPTNAPTNAPTSTPSPPPTTPSPPPTTPSPPPTTPSPPPTIPSPPPTTPSPPPTTPSPSPTTPSPPPTTPTPSPTTPSPPPTTPSPPPTTNPSCCQNLMQNSTMGFKFMGKQQDVCVSAKITGSCSKKVRFADAELACEQLNARLCTIEELEAKAARKIGCRMNKKKVWTSSPCTRGKKSGMMIAKGYTGKGSKCMKPNNKRHKAMILCCSSQC